MTTSIHVDVYQAEESDVNAYVLSDGAGTLIIDSTRNSNEANRVAELARSRGAAPQVLLITHGHPDHYLGMGALRRAFPALKVVVASQAIKSDIIGFSAWMESVGWLEGEPQMKPRSAAHPAGFDYEREIEVLDSSELRMPGGAVLALRADYPPAEADHVTTVFSPDLNALFASDLAYNEVHPWLGVGVTAGHIEGWLMLLDELAATYGPRATTIYPGHGAPTDAAVFGRLGGYIRELLGVIDVAANEREAIAAMAARYPSYRNVDFLLANSVAFQLEQARLLRSEKRGNA